MREELAKLCHSQWAGWMEYLFSKGTLRWYVDMPSWAVERLERQIRTPYEELSEQEKESDRKEADKFLPHVKRAFRSGCSIGMSPNFDIENLDEEWKYFLKTIV